MNNIFLKVNDLGRDILDELSDGQWHPFYKISKQVPKGSLKTNVFKTELQNELEHFVENDILMSGENNSYRFNSSILSAWRDFSENPMLEKKKYQPRWFGGILEDDGWLLAPLKPYDLVHFKSDPSLDRKTVNDYVQGDISLIQIENSLYRVFSKDGEDTFRRIQKLKDLNDNYYNIRGMRLEKDLKRRDLEDLPKQFLSDMCKYYGKFAAILLRPYKSSIVKHIPDPDDVQQQIFLWVLDAIQRYDDTKSIPFAAYLSSSLSKWVFNLNRSSFGRSVADAELKHSRAINAFKSEYGRNPRTEELAEILGEDISVIKKDSIIINTVVNLRNVSTIHTEDEDIPIPAIEVVNDNIDRLVSNSLLSAAIITAVKEDNKNTKNVKDLSGLLGVYHQTWGMESATKKIKLWLKSKKTQLTIKRVLTIVAQKLENIER